MGGGWFPKLVWPKHYMINQQVKVGVANNDKRAKCWCGTDEVGVATATPAIRHSPPMGIHMYVGVLCCLTLPLMVMAFATLGSTCRKTSVKRVQRIRSIS